LVLRRAKTRETLLVAGGRWDRVDRRFVGEPDTAKFVDLEESQVELALWYATWLADFKAGRPRDVSVAMAGGARRGGKTFVTTACVLAAAIEVPDSIGWLVAKSFSEVRELDDTTKSLLPQSFYRYRGAPRYEFTLTNGSRVTVESADDPERLKKGRADIVLVNEPQKIDVGAFVHSLGGTIDKGGLVLCAANPPRRLIGQWVLDFKELVEQGKIPGCKFFGFDSTLNDRIDHDARARYRDIVTALDPKSALADAEGGWFPVGDVAYPSFSPPKHIKPIPQLTDITAEVTRRKTGREYSSWGGVDFQHTPHHAGVVVKAFRGLDGRPVFWAVGEYLEQGFEDDFLDAVEEHAVITPQTHLWIGDASGEYKRDGRDVRGRRSFQVFRARGWHIVPPAKRKTERSDFAKNPDVTDRLSLVNALFGQNRIFIDPNRCPKLSIALKKCALRQGKGYGKYAHVTDALGYAIWWAQPKTEPKRTGDVARMDAWSVGDVRSSPWSY